MKTRLTAGMAAGCILGACVLAFSRRAARHG